MMSKELPLLCQTHSIDTMMLKDIDGQIRTYRNNNKRNKELITSCQLCYQEYTRQWGMHHSSHHSSHPIKSEVFLWNINTQLFYIPKSGKEESSKSSNKQRWCKGSTTTTSTICRTGSKYLCHHDKPYIEHQILSLSGKHRPTHHLHPVGQCLPFNKKS